MHDCVCVRAWVRELAILCPQLMSNKEKKVLEEAKETLSTSLMVALPDLISKVCVCDSIKLGILLLLDSWSISSVGRASC